MRKFYEEPDFEEVLFESEESVMTTSRPEPETDDEGWTIKPVKP